MSASLRVLVVDDNHLIRRLLGLILEGAGYVPVEAESAEVAFGLAVEDPPDAAIVDEMMPGMRGSDFIRALRHTHHWRLQALPVVGISGRAGARRDLLAAGATAFVPKPIEERAVLAALEHALLWRRLGGDPEHVPAA